MQAVAVVVRRAEQLLVQAAQVAVALVVLILLDLLELLTQVAVVETS
jgi:hypothetical protein